MTIKSEDMRPGGIYTFTPSALIRTFETGATRSGSDKPDYSGYLSPFALQRYGQYMLKHQIQEDGTKRSSSNWKLGIPLDSFKESLVRHVIDFWAAYEAGNLGEAEELACAIIFNSQGFLHARLKTRLVERSEPGVAVAEPLASGSSKHKFRESLSGMCTGGKHPWCCDCSYCDAPGCSYYKDVHLDEPAK